MSFEGKNGLLPIFGAFGVVHVLGRGFTEKKITESFAGYCLIVYFANILSKWSTAFNLFLSDLIPLLIVLCDTPLWGASIQLIMCIVYFRSSSRAVINTFLVLDGIIIQFWLMAAKT